MLYFAYYFGVVILIHVKSAFTEWISSWRGVIDLEVEAKSVWTWGVGAWLCNVPQYCLKR